MTGASNAQKTPLTRTLNAFTGGKSQSTVNLLGKSLPASVVSIPTPGIPIVTVKFEIQDTTFSTLPQITVPVIGSEYIRIPIQAASGNAPGTQGVVMSIDTYLGGVSGLGGGVADMTQRGNLSALIFVPIGNTAFTKVSAPNSVVIYAPTGVTLRDSQGKVDLVLDPSSGVTITGNVAINGNLTVNGSIKATGDIVAGAVSLQTHVHGTGTPTAAGTLPPTGGTAGSGAAGGTTPPTGGTAGSGTPTGTTLDPTTLPTTLPTASGQLWNDGGIVSVS